MLVLIHQEDHTAPSLLQSWPSASVNSRFEAPQLAANLVRSDIFARLEDRSDLRIQIIEHRGSERLRLDHIRPLLAVIFFRLNEDKYGYMLGVLLRPIPNHCKATHKGMACAPLIHSLYMHYLE